jgi:FlaA1/EpsC-like NDP-sugar epimerase
MHIKNFLTGKGRKFVLAVFDCCIFASVTCAYYFATLLLDTPGNISPQRIFSVAGILLATILVARAILGVYNSVWRYTRTLSYLKMVTADIIGTLVAIGVCAIFSLHTDSWLFAVIAPINAILTVC